MKRRKRNLNIFQLETDGNYNEIFRDNSIKSNENLQVFFRNIGEKLIEEIKKADVILGCVAWLTNSKIIDALAEKKVSIIIQKEDFLRPDVELHSSKKDWRKEWKKELRKRYNKLNSGLDRYMFDNILSKTSVCSDTSIDPIRCVGNLNRKGVISSPKMHNKFLIFARFVSIAKELSPTREVDYKVVPYAVWTGSFNLTKTATESLENALIIKDKEIVNAYFKEYGQICAMSEPLDWEQEWIEPQWRIGT